MKRFLILLAAVSISAIAAAMVVVYTTPIVNETGLAYSKTFTVDTNQKSIDQISAQSVVSSATIASVNFNDGGRSTMSITVQNFAALIAQPSTNTITISSDTAIRGQSFNLNGVTYTEGVNWIYDPVYSTNTAKNIAAVINGVTNFSAQASSNVVHSTVTFSGTFGNNYTLTSSTQAALVVGSPTFTNGQDNASVIINGIKLLQGTDWTAVTNASTTARNLSNAIQANTSLASIIASTWSTVAVSSYGVVTATSTASGTTTNYAIQSSTPAVLVLAPTSAMGGGTSTSISLTADTISASNSFTTALPLLYTKSAGTSPAPLVANTTYFAIPVNSGTFQLARTSTDAVAGNAIDFTSQVSTGGSTFNLAPLNFVGSAAFKWQGSNDGTNYFDLSVTSVTITSTTTANTSTNWDFAAYDYRFIRLNFVGPTSGAVAIVVTPNGKNTYKNSNQ